MESNTRTSDDRVIIIINVGEDSFSGLTKDETVCQDTAESFGKRSGQQSICGIAPHFRYK